MKGVEAWLTRVYRVANRPAKPIADVFARPLSVHRVARDLHLDVRGVLVRSVSPSHDLPPSHGIRDPIVHDVGPHPTLVQRQAPSQKAWTMAPALDVRAGQDATRIGKHDGGSAVDGEIVRVPIDGGAPTILATGGYPEEIAIDITSAYWTSSRSQVIGKVSPR